MSKQLHKLFTDTISSEEKFQQGINDFIESVKSNKKDIIKFIVEETLKLINSPKFSPLQKYNALRILAVSLDTKNTFVAEQVLENKLFQKFEELALSQKKYKLQDKGKTLFGASDQSGQEYSQEFYFLLLECIQDWASLYPVDNMNKPSKFKELYQLLLNQKVEFPESNEVNQNVSQSQPNNGKPQQQQQQQQQQQPKQQQQQQAQNNQGNQIQQQQQQQQKQQYQQQAQNNQGDQIQSQQQQQQSPPPQQQQKQQQPNIQQTGGGQSQVGAQQTKSPEQQQIESKLNELVESLKNLYETINSGDDTVDLWGFLIDEVINISKQLEQNIQSNKNKLSPELISSARQQIDQSETIASTFKQLQSQQISLKEFKEIAELFLAPYIHQKSNTSKPTSQPQPPQTQNKPNSQTSVNTQNQVQDKKLTEIENGINQIQECKESLVEAAQAGTNDLGIWEFLFSDLKDKVENLIELVDDKLPGNLKEKVYYQIEENQMLLDQFEQTKRGSKNPCQEIIQLIQRQKMQASQQSIKKQNDNINKQSTINQNNMQSSSISRPGFDQFSDIQDDDYNDLKKTQTLNNQQQMLGSKQNPKQSQLKQNDDNLNSFVQSSGMNNNMLKSLNNQSSNKTQPQLQSNLLDNQQSRNKQQEPLKKTDILNKPMDSQIKSTIYVPDKPTLQNKPNFGAQSTVLSSQFSQFGKIDPIQAKPVQNNQGKQQMNSSIANNNSTISKNSQIQGNDQDKKLGHDLLKILVPKMLNPTNTNTINQNKEFNEEIKLLKNQLQSNINYIEDLQLRIKQLQNANFDIEQMLISRKKGEENEKLLLNQNIELKKHLDEYKLENNSLNRQLYQVNEQNQQLAQQTNIIQGQAEEIITKFKDQILAHEKHIAELQDDLRKAIFEKEQLNQQKVEIMKLSKNIVGTGVQQLENQKLQNRFTLLQNEVKYLTQQLNENLNKIKIQKDDDEYTDYNDENLVYSLPNKYSYTPKISNDNKNKQQTKTQNKKVFSYFIGGNNIEEVFDKEVKQDAQNESQSSLGQNTILDGIKDDTKEIGIPLSKYFSRKILQTPKSKFTKNLNHDSDDEDAARIQRKTIKYSAKKLGENFEDPVEEAYLIQNQLSNQQEVQEDLNTELVYPFNNIADYYARSPNHNDNQKLQKHEHLVSFKPAYFQMIHNVYTDDISLNRFKYSCLAEKAATYEDNEIQIGSKSLLFLDDYQNTFQHKIDLYFGNKGVDILEKLNVEYQYDQNILLQCEPAEFFEGLGPIKQQKQTLYITAQRLPFDVVVGIFKYIPKGEKVSVQSKFIVPTLVNKFMAFREFSITEFRELYKEKNRSSVKTDHFELNPLYFQQSNDINKYFQDLINFKQAQGNIIQVLGPEEQLFGGIFTLTDGNEEYAIKFYLKHKSMCSITLNYLKDRARNAEFIVQNLIFLMKK